VCMSAGGSLSVRGFDQVATASRRYDSLQSGACCPAVQM